MNRRTKTGTLEEDKLVLTPFLLVTIHDSVECRYEGSFVRWGERTFGDGLSSKVGRTGRVQVGPRKEVTGLSCQSTCPSDSDQTGQTVHMRGDSNNNRNLDIDPTHTHPYSKGNTLVTYLSESPDTQGAVQSQCLRRTSCN